MTDSKTIGGLQTLEILNLENLLEDECKCESAHRSLPGCSIEVVGIKFLDCQGVRFLICQTSYDWNREAIQRPHSVCNRCRKPCSDCWRIVPI